MTQEQLYLIAIDPFEIFKWGVDYGQLLAEEERDSEDLADAFQGVIVDQQRCCPSSIAPRRQPHSEEWREAKAKSYNKFIDFIANCNTPTSQKSLLSQTSLKKASL
jgi:hypothetical protein